MIAAVAAAAMLVPLAACGGGNAADGKTTLSFFSNNSQDKYQPIIDAFEKANPDIKIDYSTCPHVYRTGCTGLLTPILTYLAIDTIIHRIRLFHRLFVSCQRYGSTTFHIRDKQRESLTDTVAPLSDIISFQTTFCLIMTIRFHQLTLSTHRFLTILIRMI